jgi:catechol 2,3-dioxygenase-like lactoylglutathione lyase family enzyme
VNSRYFALPNVDETTRSDAMIDHTGLIVSDFKKSKTFYASALAPIGYKAIMEFPSDGKERPNIVAFGEPPKPDFWMIHGTPNVPRSMWRFAS